VKLILHAGTHKTGTTSIQKALSDNRPWLRQHGLIYPDGSAVYGKTKVPHHRFSHAFTGTSAESSSLAFQFLDGARAQVEGPNDVILISAEPIYRHIAGYDDWQHYNDIDYWLRRNFYLSGLADALLDFEVTVLLFFRQRQSFARSLYAEVCRKGHWQGSPSKFMAHFRNWFEYEQQIAAFRAVFSDVRTLSYETALEQGLIRTFFLAIGFPMPPNTDHIWERKTLNTFGWTD
jgi:hypothetical protein